MPYHFDYISKKNPIIRKAYEDIWDIILQVQDDLRDEITFQFKSVGSYSRNMITWDKESNVGYVFDFNLDIWKGYDDFTPREIREKFINAFSKRAKPYGYSPAENSTRVLTLNVIDKKNSRILHGCDFAIVNNYVDEEGYDCQEYIHYDKEHDRFYWREQTNGYFFLQDKLDWLNDNGHKGELRALYLERKRGNLNPNLHSRDLLEQVAHQLCQKYGYYDE